MPRKRRGDGPGLQAPTTRAGTSRRVSTRQAATAASAVTPAKRTRSKAAASRQSEVAQEKISAVAQDKYEAPSGLPLSSAVSDPERSVGDREGSFINNSDLSENIFSAQQEVYNSNLGFPIASSNTIDSLTLTYLNSNNTTDPHSEFKDWNISDEVLQEYPLVSDYTHTEDTPEFPVESAIPFSNPLKSLITITQKFDIDNACEGQVMPTSLASENPQFRKPSEFSSMCETSQLFKQLIATAVTPASLIKDLENNPTNSNADESKCPVLFSNSNDSIMDKKHSSWNDNDSDDFDSLTVLHDTSMDFYNDGQRTKYPRNSVAKTEPMAPVQLETFNSQPHVKSVTTPILTHPKVKLRPYGKRGSKTNQNETTTPQSEFKSVTPPGPEPYEEKTQANVCQESGISNSSIHDILAVADSEFSDGESVKIITLLESDDSFNKDESDNSHIEVDVKHAICTGEIIKADPVVKSELNQLDSVNGVIDREQQIVSPKNSFKVEQDHTPQIKVPCPVSSIKREYRSYSDTDTASETERNEKLLEASANNGIVINSTVAVVDDDPAFHVDQIPKKQKLENLSSELTVSNNNDGGGKATGIFNNEPTKKPAKSKNESKTKRTKVPGIGADSKGKARMLKQDKCKTTKISKGAKSKQCGNSEKKVKPRGRPRTISDPVYEGQQITFCSEIAKETTGLSRTAAEADANANPASETISTANVLDGVLGSDEKHFEENIGSRKLQAITGVSSALAKPKSDHISEDVEPPLKKAEVRKTKAPAKDSQKIRGEGKKAINTKGKKQTSASLVSSDLLEPPSGTGKSKSPSSPKSPSKAPTKKVNTAAKNLQQENKLSIQNSYSNEGHNTGDLSAQKPTRLLWYYNQEHKNIMYTDEAFVALRGDLHKDEHIYLWRIMKKYNMVRKFVPIEIDGRHCHYGVDKFRKYESEDALVCQYQPIVFTMIVDTPKFQIGIYYNTIKNLALLAYFPSTNNLFGEFNAFLRHMVIRAMTDDQQIKPENDVHGGATKSAVEVIETRIGRIVGEIMFGRQWPKEILMCILEYPNINKTKKGVQKTVDCVACSTVGRQGAATYRLLFHGECYDASTLVLTHKPGPAMPTEDCQFCYGCPSILRSLHRLVHYKYWVFVTIRMQLKQLYQDIKPGQRYKAKEVFDFIVGDFEWVNTMFYEFQATLGEGTQAIEKTQRQKKLLERKEKSVIKIESGGSPKKVGRPRQDSYISSDGAPINSATKAVKTQVPKKVKKVSRESLSTEEYESDPKTNLKEPEPLLSSNENIDVQVELKFQGHLDEVEVETPTPAEYREGCLAEPSIENSCLETAPVVQLGREVNGKNKNEKAKPSKKKVKCGPRDSKLKSKDISETNVSPITESQKKIQECIYAAIAKSGLPPLKAEPSSVIIEGENDEPGRLSSISLTEH